MRKLIHYKHYNREIAEEEFNKTRTDNYRVITINWTYATIKHGRNKGMKKPSMAHKNEYIFPLEELIEFIRRTEDVCEDIICIDNDEKEVLKYG